MQTKIKMRENASVVNVTPSSSPLDSNRLQLLVKLIKEHCVGHTNFISKVPDVLLPS
jgi:hypothetical protein